MASGDGSRGTRLFVYILIDQERGEGMLVLKHISIQSKALVHRMEPLRARQIFPPSATLWESLNRHTKRCASLIPKGLDSPTRLIIAISHHTRSFCAAWLVSLPQFPRLQCWDNRCEPACLPVKDDNTPNSDSLVHSLRTRELQAVLFYFLDLAKMKNLSGFSVCLKLP